MGAYHRNMQQNRNLLVDNEKVISSKLAETPNQVNIKHHYGIELKSTTLINVMIVFSDIISLGLGTLYEKNRQLDNRKSLELS